MRRLAVPSGSREAEIMVRAFGEAWPAFRQADRGRGMVFHLHETPKKARRNHIFRWRIHQAAATRITGRGQAQENRADQATIREKARRQIARPVSGLVA